MELRRLIQRRVEVSLFPHAQSSCIACAQPAGSRRILASLSYFVRKVTARTPIASQLARLCLVNVHKLTIKAARPAVTEPSDFNFYSWPFVFHERVTSY
jgi:hypothetical protein